MRNIAKKMVPSWETFTKKAFSNAGSVKHEIEQNCSSNVFELPDSVNNDDIIHHNDNSWNTANDEYDSNHNENN